MSRGFSETGDPFDDNLGTKARTASGMIRPKQPTHYINEHGELKKMNDWPQSYTDPEEVLKHDDPWLEWAKALLPEVDEATHQTVAKALRASYWKGQGEPGDDR